MSKIREALLNKVTKTKPNDKELFGNEERRFGEDFEKFSVFRVDSPIDVFVTTFKYEKLELKFDSKKDATERSFMIMMELEEMLKDEADTPIYLQNLISIVKGNDLKIFSAKLNFKQRQVAKVEEENSFSLPKDYLQLQKIGRLLKRTEIRDCYMTQQAIGQIKNKDKKKLFKPNLFRDQYVVIESKNKVNAAIEKEKELKAKGMNMKKVLAWPEKKELNKYNIRLRFEEMKSDRQRAIYISSIPFAMNLKNHAVVQRVLHIDPNKKLKINVLKTIWKVKHAEYFYNNYLKPFFRDPNSCKELVAYNETLKNRIKNYLKVNYPNLYDSQYDPNNRYNFHDNSHLLFKKPAQEATAAELEISKTQFATTLYKAEYSYPSQAEVLKSKKRIHLKSPFEELDYNFNFNPTVFGDFLHTFESEPRSVNIQDSTKEAFIRYIIKNSKLILSLNKLVIKNVFTHRACPLEESEIDNLLFTVQTSVEKGNAHAESTTIIDEVDTNYISFDMDNSLKVDVNGLDNIRFKLVNAISDKVLVDTILQLHTKIDTVYLENTFFQEIEFDYKGQKIQGVIQFILVFVPRNLEIAHFTLNKLLIETNFERFMEILKNSNTYKPYRQNFFSEKYLKVKSTNPTNDYFYYLNNNLKKRFSFVTKQENLFCKSNIASDLETYRAFFKVLLNKDNLAADILQDTVVKLEKGEKLGVNLFYDMDMHVLSLLSPQSRLMLHWMIYDHFHKSFVSSHVSSATQGYHHLMIIELTKHLKELFESEYNYLQSEQKYLVYKLTFDVYLMFDNNSFNGKSYQIHFSKHHIPIIIKYVQLNSNSLKDDDVRFLVVNQIISSQYMRNYTSTNHLMYVDGMIVYFKILFKNLYTDFYRIFTNKMLNFDALLARVFMNSYADYFDSINYNTYNDLKFTLQSVFMVQNSYHKLFERLGKIKMSFGSLFDILFALQALVSSSDLFSELPAHKFTATIEQAFRRESYNLKDSLKKVLKLLDYLYDQNFIEKDFNFFEDIIQNKHDNKIASYKNLMLNIKTLGITSEIVKDIIDKEIVKNDVFALRALAIYRKEKYNTSKSMKDSQDEPDEPESARDLIDEDIYFEIAEDFEDDIREDIDGLQKKQLFKYTGCLIYLHNLDYNLIEDNMGSVKLQADFNNILELNVDEMSEFSIKYLKAPEMVQMEMFNDLSNLTGDKKVSLMRLLIIIICSYSENHAEILENLTYLATKLTEIIYGGSVRGLFNEAIMYIIDEVYNLTPMTYFADFMHNLIENHTSDFYCHIKTARLTLESDIIDISQICIKHFASNTFLSKKPNLIFNDTFCKDIEIIISNLIQEGQIKPDFSKFTLFLEVSAQKKPKYYSIPFKISFVPETKIFCKRRDPLYFENEISDQNLMDSRALEQFYRNSPFCFFNTYTSLKLPINFLDLQLVLKFRTRKEVFLTVTLTFTERDNIRTCSNLMPWYFKNPDADRLVKFAKQYLNIELYYTYFFMSLGELYKYVSVIITEQLEADDIFRFVKLNNEKHSFTNVKNKDVMADAQLFDLAAFEEAVKNKEPYIINVNYKV